MGDCHICAGLRYHMELSPWSPSHAPDEKMWMEGQRRREPNGNNEETREIKSSVRHQTRLAFTDLIEIEVLQHRMCRRKISNAARSTAPEKWRIPLEAMLAAVAGKKYKVLQSDAKQMKRLKKCWNLPNSRDWAGAMLYHSFASICQLAAACRIQSKEP